MGRVCQQPEVSETVEALPTVSQVAAVSQQVEAPLTSAQPSEVGQPAPEPVQAGRAGRALREVVCWPYQFARSAAGGTRTDTRGHMGPVAWVRACTCV